MLLSGSMLVSVSPARANDFWSSVGGSVVGTVVGNAISDRVTQPQPKRVYVPVERAPAKPAISSAQRAQNARIQTALNYFGFPAGAADGVIGRGTRAAAANYQAYMGYPASGYLADYEIGTLLGAYDWALTGGAAVNQALASGQGGRGLLVAYRQQMVGAPAAPVAPAAAPAVVPAAASVPATAPMEQATVPAASPSATTPAGLPTFIAGAKAAASMNATCARVAVTTNADGGPIKASASGAIDLDQMLSEQFCLARGYAMSQGESLAATAQGFTTAQIEEQCLAFAPTMARYVSELNWTSPDALAKDLREFVAGTGVPPEQLSANARICLGVGYRLDNPDLSLASALVLVGLNEDAYAELVGHQMRLGLGSPARPSYGLDWIDYAVEALNGGAPPLVPQDADDRLALLQDAVLSDAIDEMFKTLPASAPPAPASAGEEAKMQLPGAAAPTPPASSN